MSDDELRSALLHMADNVELCQDTIDALHEAVARIDSLNRQLERMWHRLASLTYELRA